MPVGPGLDVIVRQTNEVGEEEVHLFKPDKMEVWTHGSVSVRRTELEVCLSAFDTGGGKSA